MSETDLPVLESANYDVEPDDEVGCVLLAAGRGTRFSEGNKLLHEIDGVPIIRRAVQPFLAVAEDVVVVVGHDASAVRAALDGLNVTFVVNEAYLHGQSTSLHCGIVVARNRGWNGVLFGLGDMPFITSQSVQQLVNVYAESTYTILAAAYEGMQGNPTLFDASHYDALITIEGDRGGQKLITKSNEAVLVETNDPGVVRDIDTVSDIK
ncbi:nucleotidyltransferase family protein [Halocatena pleomorpha]|uniref:Nucleotidyltransferase family protein n=1 Tax=Halocatena pleomorpha TaxID=1785090 RepID=A0A3P3RJ81_9EURY|nr:nucleotidyltransferase family protein [Halocatena pleomorpha]RRJ33597.1 nucleotidyltransferase family protein [Halocatena pleomorpha]